MKTPCVDCGKLVEKSAPIRAGGIRCVECTPLNNASSRTEAKRQVQNSGEWRKLRRRKMLRDPLCEDCLVQGETTVAVDAHHKVPRFAGGALLVPLDDLLSLCKRHHALHTAEEQRAGYAPAPLRKYPAHKEYLIA